MPSDCKMIGENLYFLVDYYESCVCDTEDVII